MAALFLLYMIFFVKGSVHCNLQVRNGVITLLEAWIEVSPANRVLPAVADFLDSPKAFGAEGKVGLACPAFTR